MDLLRLRQMLLMLQRCAEDWLGRVETAKTPVGLQNTAYL